MDRMRLEETTWANWESYVAIIIFCQAWQCSAWYQYVIDTRMDYLVIHRLILDRFRNDSQASSG